MKYHFPSEDQRKVFIKRGTSLMPDIRNGAALYESVMKHSIVSALNRLHYSPDHYRAIFSDIFIVSPISITISGIVMTKGANRNMYFRFKYMTQF